MQLRPGPHRPQVTSSDLCRDCTIYLHRCELKLVTPGPSLTSALPGLGLVTALGGLVLLLLLLSALHTRAR